MKIDDLLFFYFFQKISLTICCLCNFYANSCTILNIAANNNFIRYNFNFLEINNNDVNLIYLVEFEMTVIINILI